MAKRCNQLTIKISEDTTWGHYRELFEACRCLNGAALKLYIYFTSMPPGEEFYFFPKIFCELYNVSMSSEKNALQELIIEGYIKQKETDYLVFSSCKDSNK